MTPTPTPAALRARAEALAGHLPPLLAEAEHLAANVTLGEHGRRRAGQGDEFWQFRPAHAGDEARAIDWRHSARSDAHFVREKEWQAAQSVVFWSTRRKAWASQGIATARKGRTRPASGAGARGLAVTRRRTGGSCRDRPAASGRAGATDPHRPGA
ncbi:MAG: DUF58 domain-containing protein [Paracoccaceae bacterium]